VESAIACTLHGTEDTVTGGGANKAHIEKSLEWTSLLAVLLHGIVLTIDFINTLVHGVHVEGSQKSTSAEETSSVRSSVVSMTGGDAIALQLT